VNPIDGFAMPAPMSTRDPSMRTIVIGFALVALTAGPAFAHPARPRLRDRLEDM
jgi:hypothetical protein